MARIEWLRHIVVALLLSLLDSIILLFEHLLQPHCSELDKYGDSDETQYGSWESPVLVLSIRQPQVERLPVQVKYEHALLESAHG